MYVPCTEVIGKNITYPFASFSMYVFVMCLDAYWCIFYIYSINALTNSLNLVLLSFMVAKDLFLLESIKKSSMVSLSFLHTLCLQITRYVVLCQCLDFFWIVCSIMWSNCIAMFVFWCRFIPRVLIWSWHGNWY